MASLFDYIKWRGDIPLSQVPLNEVDSLILSLLSYLDYSGIVSEEHDGTCVPLRAVANTYFSRNPDYKKVPMGLILPKEIILLLREVKDSRRFRNLQMRAYVNRVDTEREMQFSATTFLSEDGAMFVAFRGTDDTLVGWKEDLNMSIFPEVPAQRAATAYLVNAAQNCDGPIYTMGHSKGGNLSVYAAVMADADVQERLVQVWNFDGPGFRDEFYENSSYHDLRPLIRTVLPKDTLVGMLLTHEERYTVVKSKQSGAWQHNALNWEVMGGGFIQLPGIAIESKRADKSINEWIRSMSDEQRQEFIEALYSILTVENSATLTDVSALGVRWLAKSKELDPKVRKTLQEFIIRFFNINTKNLLNDFLGKNNLPEIELPFKKEVKSQKRGLNLLKTSKK